MRCVLRQAQCLLGRVRSGLVSDDIFGSFAFVGDLAQVDVLKLCPDKSDGDRGQEGYEED